MDPNAQILLAISHEKDQNTVGYKIGLALELLVVATSGFDGHQHAEFGPSAGVGFGSPFGSLSGPARSSELGSDSDVLIWSTFDSPRANAGHDTVRFRSPGQPGIIPDPLTMAPTTGKSAPALAGSVRRTQPTGSTLLSDLDSLFGAAGFFNLS